MMSSIYRSALALGLFWALLTCLALPAAVQAQLRTSPPEFNPESRSFNGTLDVELTCINRSYSVYYTTDGSTPSTESKYGSSPIDLEVTQTTTIKALCRYSSFGFVYTSEVAEETYTQQAVPKPTVTPGGGYYNPDSAGKLAVKVSGESNATLRYTLDGSIPTEKSASIVSGGTVQVTPTQTLNVIAMRTGWAPSPMLSEIYYKKETVPKPTANHGKDTSFSSALSVTLASVSGAAIYYTLDGSAPVAGKNLYGLPLSLPLATTTLRAIATKENMNTSQELKVLYTYLPKAPQPQAIAFPGTFTDTTRVLFQNPAAGLEIRYTTNGQTPTQQSPLYQGGILVDTTLVLTVRTFPAASTAQYAPSDAVKYNLSLNLAQPTADKYVNGDYYRYRDSLAVKVTSDNSKAQILYTLGGTIPAPKTGSILSKSNPFIRIGDKDTTVIQAIAITLDTTIRSPVAVWKYIKDPTPKLPAPQAIPPGKVFQGSLPVTLKSGDRNTTIVYTLDGSEPSRAGNGVQGNGIEADSGDVITLTASTTLKLKAYRDTGIELPSVISSEVYLLQPEPPVPSIMGGTVAAGKKIALSTPTPHAKIFYSLEPGPLDIATAPLYNDSIEITRSLTLQAMATLGTGSTLQTSPIVSYSFTIEEKPGLTTIGHDTVKIEAYKLVLETMNSPSVSIVYDTLPPFIDGLHLQRPIRLQPTQSGDKVEVWVGSQETQGFLLYLIVGGQAKVVSAKLPVVVREAGLYAFGIDTLVPQVQLLSQTVNTDDSTEVRLEVRDNTLNPFYQVQTSGAQKWSEVRTLRGPVDTLELRVKNANGLVEDLWLRLRVGDYRRVIGFPADTSSPLVLPQGFGNLATPPTLQLGRSDYRWDLVGFPAATSNPVSLARLAEDNAGYQFKAYHLNNFTENEQIESDAPMVPGKGYWLATDKPTQSLKLTRVKTPASDTNGTFKVNLKTGWNLIANPSLRTLYWPSSRRRADFDQMSVRGLVPFSHVVQDYSTSDSLEPFRGYFVYYRNSYDTLVTLLRHPPVGSGAEMAAGKQAADKKTAITQRPIRSWRVVLGESLRVPVTLGAIEGAHDGLSSEDESALSAPVSIAKSGTSSPTYRLHARRENRALMSDYVGFTPNEAKLDVKRFSVAFGSASNSQPVPEIKVSDLRLPAGYEAWAWLPDRKLRQPLTEGESLTWWTSSSDSLVVLVGPTEALRQTKAFQNANLQPLSRQIRLFQAKNHIRLEIDLPSKQSLKIQSVKANGQTHNLLKNQELGAGFHRFEWPRQPTSEMIRIQGHDLKTLENWSHILR
jgi:Chitobiase/beta-hexosaminidase C-terminal domain